MTSDDLQVPDRTAPSAYPETRSRVAHIIRLSGNERAMLKDRLRDLSLPSNQRLRAMALLMSDQGWLPRQIAKKLGVSAGVVSRWRTLYVRSGIEGVLTNRKRPMWYRKYGPDIRDAIIRLAATAPPPGARWWTAKLIAARLDGISWQYVNRVIKAAGVDLRAGRRRIYPY